MPKFNKAYSGGSLRTLLYHYSNDRSKVDPAFKQEFDAEQSKQRQARAIAAAARAAREAAKAVPVAV